MVNPLTAIGLTVPVPTRPSGEDVTVYDVAVGDELKLIVAMVFPGLATTLVGAEGTPRGVMKPVLTDGAEVPVPLEAVTVNEYVVPLINPVTRIGLALPDPVNPPGEDVAVYEIAALVAKKYTVAAEFPATAEMLVGTGGIGLTITGLDAAEKLEEPEALIAIILKI